MPSAGYQGGTNRARAATRGRRNGNGKNGSEMGLPKFVTTSSQASAPGGGAIVITTTGASAVGENVAVAQSVKLPFLPALNPHFFPINLPKIYPTPPPIQQTTFSLS